MPDSKLRVIDFGSQSPLRSQTFWHAIAYGVSAGEPPTLSFVTPSAPYVSLGYHRRIEEIDLDACRRRGLPVFRRMVGGGPVYLDPDQLFFQISVPVALVPAFGPRAMERLLSPAVEAFNDVGVAAAFDDRGDVSVGEVKISGVAGGQIEACAIAVGNLVHSFDYTAMAAVLGLEQRLFDAEVIRLMRAFFRPTPVDEDAFKGALIHRYARAFDAVAEPGLMSGYELELLEELDARFNDPEWLSGPQRTSPPARQIKIRSGVWAFSAQHEGTKVMGSVIDGSLACLFVEDPTANGHASAIEAALEGTRLEEVPAVASRFGPTGTRVAAAISSTDGRGL